jgi:squalene-hopene/tetraprenyl-beta-curcumene cyclase
LTIEATWRGRIRAALAKARDELLAERNAGGHWEGELSSSALSTATAVTALAVYEREGGWDQFAQQIQAGLRWLAEHTNADGGWGDTTISRSNLSTTTLCWAAFGAASAEAQIGAVAPSGGALARPTHVESRAERWLQDAVGSSDIHALARAVAERYGKDRTFSAPILTMCALSGRFGTGPDAWEEVIQLPFELAAIPSRFYSILRLPVVSYALPALIAVGQAKHFHAPTGNAIIDGVRNWLKPRTLEILRGIQPSSGGFLEATPLTSFVAMSLAGSGQAQHPVTRKGVEFLRASQRRDGSWAIDTNLATWVTTLAVNALGLDLKFRLASTERQQVVDWLLNQQYTHVHPYTNAAPGGWAWTNLPGGVPDADDTCGALLALARLGLRDWRVQSAAEAGLQWLIDLQNADGGLPTFCRGWGALPFDRSSADITAHGIEAWLAWLDDAPPELRQGLQNVIRCAVQFLYKHQTASGAWAPLWFGNEHAADEQNLTYGTSRVVTALATLAASEPGEWFEAYFQRALKQMISTGVAWLLKVQQQNGGWSGSEAGPVSIEETALALTALAGAQRHVDTSVTHALTRGTNWLIERVESGAWKNPAPIGFYFARLWYYERLYPLIFAVGALSAVAPRL